LRGRWGAGKSAFYIRARLTQRVGSGDLPLINRVWCGPNHWNPVTKDAGTAPNVTATAHADPLKYGLTLHQSESVGPQTVQLTKYSVGDKPIEFVNKVVVRGAGGAYGSAQDENSIRQFGIVKEKVVHSSSIDNSVKAEQTAVKLLNQLKPITSSDSNITASSTISTIREVHASTREWPISYLHKKPRPLRAGDVVNVVIHDKGIFDEKWYVSSIAYDALQGEVDMILYRDLDRIVDSGPAETKALRDLMGRTRELSRGVFNTLDSVVEGGLDFMPEGPSRTVGRIAYESIGTYSDVTTDGTTKRVDLDNFRWNLKLYDDHKANSANRTQLRIDHSGARPDLTSSAGNTVDTYATDGAGIGFIGRSQYSSFGTNSIEANNSPINNTSYQGTPTYGHHSWPAARDYFYPAAGEATLYLRKALAARGAGSGLYIAHRGIWNDDAYGASIGTVAADGSTFPIQLHHEVFVGASGVIVYDSSDNATKEVHNILPDLIDKPMVFLQIAETVLTTNNPSPTAVFQKLTASVRSWQTNSGSGSAVRYRGFNVSLYKADGSNGLVDSTQADVPVMYLVVFNSARDQRWDSDHA